jgi:3-oxoacyl-[acyl-carrier-protein] synthase-3
VGSYVPERILTNAELGRMVDTSDEWITTRTGIKERRLAAKNEFTSDLAAQAALRAMHRAGVTPEQIELIIVATITPDMPFPSTACLVQRKIGAHRAAAFDLEAACSGFIYGLEIAQQFIMSRTYDTVLVIGAEKLSSIVDWKDRNTCVLFGDGAGAAILQNRPNAHGLLTAVMGADGRKADLLFMAGGGSRCPATAESVASGMHYLRRRSRTQCKRCRLPRRKHCGAVKSISRASNASSLTRPIVASSMPLPNASAPNPSNSSSTSTSTETPPPLPWPLPWTRLLHPAVFNGAT